MALYSITGKKGIFLDVHPLSETTGQKKYIY